MGLENVVGLIRNLMQLSTTVGDMGEEGAVPSLWSQLPKIVVVGGQVRCLLVCMSLLGAPRLLVTRQGTWVCSDHCQAI